MTIVSTAPWILSGPPVAPADVAVLWSSADLLRRCKQHARRPASDASMTDPMWYSNLTEAQAEVYPRLFATHPELGYSAPVQMGTLDDGYTYLFGYDAAGEDIRPSGHAEIFATLEDIPDNPLVDGEDFIAEGNLIRMLGNSPVNYSAGPWARLILAPDIPISATYEPLLYPKPARMMFVWLALASWAARPGSGMSPDYYQAKYETVFQNTLLDLATAYNRNTGKDSRWWSGLELYLTGRR
jgi:hypothetical protein